jgi:hypothetical protein
MTFLKLTTCNWNENEQVLNDHKSNTYVVCRKNYESQFFWFEIKISL